MSKEKDRLLAAHLAGRIAMGASVEDLEDEQKGPGFTFTHIASGATMFFSWSITDYRADDWRTVIGVAHRLAEDVPQTRLVDEYDGWGS